MVFTTGPEIHNGKNKNNKMNILRISKLDHHLKFEILSDIVQNYKITYIF